MIKDWMLSPQEKELGKYVPSQCLCKADMPLTPEDIDINGVQWRKS